MQPKKKKTLFELFESATLVFCLIMFSLSLFVYYNKIPLRFYIFPSMNLNNLQEIGEVNQAVGTVQRKSNSSGSYSDLTNSSPLFQFDTIKTGENSSLKIQMKDGSIIELSENSVMVLEFSRAFSWNKGIYRSPNIKVLKGDVVAENLNVNKAVERKVASEKKKVKRKVKKVVITKSLKSIKVFSPEDLKSEGVLLSWSSSSKLDNYNIEFFDFKKKLVFKASSNSEKLLLTNKKVLSQQFYYRVVSRKGQVVYYSNWGVYDRRYLPPTYLEPAEKPLALSKLNGKKIILSWEETLGQKYLVEISGKADFKKTSRYPASQNFLVLKPKARAKYYWRVRTIFKGKKGPPSKTRVLELK